MWDLFGHKAFEMERVTIYKLIQRDGECVRDGNCARRGECDNQFQDATDDRS